MPRLESKIRIIFLRGIILLALSINSNFAQNPATYACGTPTLLRINNLTSTSGQLNWNPVSGATGYVVRFKPVSSTIWLRQTSGNTTEFISGLLPNTRYEAKVKSDCAGIESLYCNLFYFTTSSNTSCGVTNSYYFTSDSITSNSCKVGWKFISGAISYNVQFRIRYSNTNWLTKNSTTNSLLISGLNPLTQYEFKVQTICNSGAGNYSMAGIFTTTNFDMCLPINHSVSDITLTSATLSWNLLSCASSYNLKFRQIGMSWQMINTTANSYPLSNLEEGTAYEFILQSINLAGITSRFTHPFVFSTYAYSESCEIPTNITIGSISLEKLTISWNAISGASKYIVRYRKAGSLTWQNFFTEVNNAIITGLSPDIVYEYQVQTICNGSIGNYSATTTFETLSSIDYNIPVPDHIVICIMENKAFSQLMGSTITPHISGLVEDPKSALFLESYGITHPSQPNYIELFSGNNQGVTNNNKPAQHFTTPNLANELIKKGLTFIGYNEGLPSVGYDGSTSGLYARKHNPVSNWMGTGINQVPDTLNQPFSSFPSDYNLLPTVSFVSPDLKNNMHNGTLLTALANGDAWFFSNMVPYIEWAKTHNSLFILTADEDDGLHNNHILTIFSGAMIKNGSYTQRITHHNILRTIEEMYDLSFIGNSANVSSIHDCWTNGFRIADEQKVIPQTTKKENIFGWKVFPNPAFEELNATFILSETADVTINIYNSIGSLTLKDKLGVIEKGSHTYNIPMEEKYYPSGIYFIDISYGSNNYKQKIIVSHR